MKITKQMRVQYINTLSLVLVSLVLSCNSVNKKKRIIHIIMIKERSSQPAII